MYIPAALPHVPPLCSLFAQVFDAAAGAKLFCGLIEVYLDKSWGWNMFLVLNFDLNLIWIWWGGVRLVSVKCHISSMRIAPQTDGLEISHNSCHTTFTAAIVTLFFVLCPCGAPNAFSLFVYVSKSCIHIQFPTALPRHSGWPPVDLYSSRTYPFVFHSMFLPIYTHTQSNPLYSSPSHPWMLLQVQAVYTSLHIHIYIYCFFIPAWSATTIPCSATTIPSLYIYMCVYNISIYICVYINYI